VEPSNLIKSIKSVGRPRLEKVISSRGYVCIRAPWHPHANGSGKYVFEHRLVMEKMIGRYLLPTEAVHHMDHDKQNNLPDNLQLMSVSDHSKLHSGKWFGQLGKGKKYSAEFRQRLSELKKLWWVERRRMGLSNGRNGKKHTAESKRKMSESRKRVVQRKKNNLIGRG
jgi:hypothetical protein